jgi:leader peptidase (prepilin peptidase)/N-methyltransferase
MLADCLVPAFWSGFGLCVGSFINVVIHRLPRNRSLLRPASHCPRCRKPVAYRDNIPIVGYALLGGKCRYCRKRISCRYPMVEALTGALACALSLKYAGNVPWILLSITAAAAFVAVAFIDWDTFIIPNELSLGLSALGLAASPLNPVFEGPGLSRFTMSFAGGLAGLAICWGVATFGEKIFKKEAMGGGDIKLLAAVGAWSGVLGAFDGLIVASFFGAIYGVGLLFRKKASRQDPIPFGPFLSAAAILNFFYILPFGFPFNP